MGKNPTSARCRRAGIAQHHQTIQISLSQIVDSGWRLGATKKQVRLCLSASSVSGSHTTSPTHLQDLARIAQSAIRLQDATMEIHGIIYGMVAQLQTAAAASA